MIVTKVYLENFTTYQEQELYIDPALTLIVGANGHGKSSIPKALCWGLYGETPDGSAPETPNKTCKVHIIFRQGGVVWEVRRERLNSKTELKLFKDATNVSGQTTTATQGVIDGLLGSFDQFMATRLFHREFLTKFGTATDKEKKALLENLLGLELFDKARELSKADLTNLGLHLAGNKATLSAAEETAKSCQNRLQKLKNIRDINQIQAELDHARSEFYREEAAEKELREKFRFMTHEFSKIEVELSLITKEIAATQKNLASLNNFRESAHNVKTCPTCGQTLSQQPEVMTSHYDQEISKVSAELKILNDKKKPIANHHRAVSGGLQTIENLLKQFNATEYSKTVTNRAVELSQAQAVDNERSILNSELEEANTKISNLKSHIASLEHQELLLNCVQDVYGVRGARCVALSDALKTLQKEANAVLKELGIALTLTINSTTKQKSGKEIDAVSISVSGAGGGEYKALSSGERSRVDVALLLAISRLRGGFGLIIFDEVMDSLDDSGVDSLSTYLQSLTNNQLIVISHLDTLISMMPRSKIIKAIKVNDVSRIQAI